MNHNDLILFIGDSITESGRFEDPEELGNGYVRLIHDYLVTSYPDKKLRVLNKGIGGHRINDLEARWDQDVIQLNPQYVSISIGINDVWRQIDAPEMSQIMPEQFEEIYRKLLTQLKEKTEARIILMEPTVIEEVVSSEGNTKLKTYVEIVRDIADEFGATLIPTHQKFLSYLRADNGYKLTTDGVHMNSAGNMLMAQSWIDQYKGIVE